MNEELEGSEKELAEMSVDPVFDYAEHMINIQALHKMARNALLERKWQEAFKHIDKMLWEVKEVRRFCVEMSNDLC